MQAHELAQYAQQIKLFDIGISGQNKLKNSKVLCVGAGGLASSCLLYLSAAGVGTLGVMDDDCVELSNLPRQILYDQSHVGKPKVTVAAEKIKNANEMVTYQEKLTTNNAETIFQNYDIVVDCTDNFTARYLINDMCVKTNKPFVFASINEYKGQAGVVNGSIGPCYRCLFPSAPTAGVINTCESGGVLGPLPGILGLIQATEVVKHILKLGEGLVSKLLLIDIFTMQFEKFHFSRDPNCQYCRLA